MAARSGGGAVLMLEEYALGGGRGDGSGAGTRQIDEGGGRAAAG